MYPYRCIFTLFGSTFLNKTAIERLNFRPIRTSTVLSGPSVTTYRVPAPADLTPYVMEFWEYQVDPTIAYVPVQVFPNGCVSIRFNIKPEEVEPILYGPSICNNMKGLFFRDWTIFGVALWPYRSYQLLGLSLEEVRDLRIHLDCIFPRQTRDLCERIHATTDMPERIAVLSDFLRESLRKKPPAADFLNAYLKLVSEAPLHADVRAITSGSRTSDRHLRRHFKKYLGLGPKETHKLIKVQHAISLLGAEPNRNLARLAVDLGFSDQAHLSRAFKSTVGLTPKRFRGLIGHMQDPTLDIWSGLDPVVKDMPSPKVVRFR